jgi:predicted dehydrogenase
MPTRILVIGAGPNAAGHARYYAKSSRATLVAVADPDQARAQALAAETGSRAIADFRSALGDVDAVVVSSPNFLHLEHALAVCAAGRHLYCEKPMGLSLADAERIVDAVEAAKVASQVGFSPRNTGVLRSMTRRARAGEFGRIVGVTSRRLMNSDPSRMGGWRADPEKSGGLLMEINIHELDWMMTVAGKVDTVSARTWAAQPGHPRANDRVWVTLGHAGGAVGVHEGGWRSPVANFYRCVEGADGGAQTDEWGGKLFICPRLADRIDTAPDPDFDLRGNWLDAIEGRGTAEADVRWAREVMAVGEAVFASAAAGGAVVPVIPRPSTQGV